jgi:hypothetical protein
MLPSCAEGSSLWVKGDRQEAQTLAKVLPRLPLMCSMPFSAKLSVLVADDRPVAPLVSVGYSQLEAGSIFALAS